MLEKPTIRNKATLGFWASKAEGSITICYISVLEEKEMYMFPGGEKISGFIL